MNCYAIVLETKDFETAPDEIDEVLDLVRSGIYDFIQFVVFPDTYKSLRSVVKEKFEGIETIIHAPFFMHGINLSDPNLLNSNLQKLSDSQRFADDLKSNTIVLHPAIGDGECFLEETVRQMKILNDSRIAVENLPYHPRPKHKMHGTTPLQIKMIMDEVGCNFCFDIAHAICAINSFKLDTWSTLAEFNKLKPTIYHLSDGDNDVTVDYHQHLGEGNYDLPKIFSLFSNSKIVLETRRKEGDLKSCINDIRLAKKLEEYTFETI